MSQFKIPKPDLQITFYHIEQITDEGTTEFEDFKENLLSRVGISG